MAEIYENLLTDVTLAIGDKIRVVTAAGNSRKATLSDLAGTIFENDVGVNYDTNSKTVKGAINELNSNKVEASVQGHKLILS